MSKAIKIAKENEFKYIQLGLNIAYYRKLQGYTQEELAELTGISRSHISALERLILFIIFHLRFYLICLMYCA